TPADDMRLPADRRRAAGEDSSKSPTTSMGIYTCSLSPFVSLHAPLRSQLTLAVASGFKADEEEWMRDFSPSSSSSSSGAHKHNPDPRTSSLLLFPQPLRPWSVK
ncbi:unnamed protein product, partial [Pleuronectes platessa]